MAGIWAWVGRHGRAIKLGSVAVALVLLAGGLLLGMSSASGTSSPAGLGTAPAAVQEVTSHYLVGTVVEVALTPGNFILRGRGGRYYVISYDKDTLVRRDRRPAQPGAVRRGARVIILGEPKQGRLHADVVTVTGYAPARQVPANQNQKLKVAPTPSVSPSASPAPRPTPRALSGLPAQSGPPAGGYAVTAATASAAAPPAQPWALRRDAGSGAAAAATATPPALHPPAAAIGTLIKALVSVRDQAAAPEATPSPIAVKGNQAGTPPTVSLVAQRTAGPSTRRIADPPLTRNAASQIRRHAEAPQATPRAARLLLEAARKPERGPIAEPYR